MGMPQDRYKTFGELRKHVIKPAVEEVNALADSPLMGPFRLNELRQPKEIKRPQADRPRQSAPRRRRALPR
jgi:hypothetical protein